MKHGEKAGGEEIRLAGKEDGCEKLQFSGKKAGTEHKTWGHRGGKSIDEAGILH